MPDERDHDRQVMAAVSRLLRIAPGERERYVAFAAHGDQDLQREILETLYWEEQMGAFLQQPIARFSDGSHRFTAGQVLSDRFEILREIGEGGMGVVYEAFDRKRHQKIAIKCAKPGCANFLQPELQGALKVRHPNVCLVNEIHTTYLDGQSIDFLTMELLEGEPLTHWLSGGKQFSLQLVDAIASQLCSGLAEAHRCGVIHRDLKPSNIMLCLQPDGEVRAVITDFGLAGESSEMQEEWGTPAYMAPELWRGAKASKASDIYALGALLHEILTVHDKQAGNADSSAGQRAAYRKLADEFLNIDPVRRSIAFDNAAHLLNRARNQLPLLDATGTVARTPGEEQTARESDERPVRRAFTRRWGIAIVIAAVCLLAGVLLWRHWSNVNSGPPLQVVLLPLEGSTGDPALDRALVSVYRVDLLQSPLVTVVSADTVATILQTMQRNPHDPMNLATAREVCERSNSQAVLRSTLARTGQHFLLTGKVIGCVDGQTIAAIKNEVSRPDDLPGAIDTLTDTFRRKLGESRNSIARFNTRLPDAEVSETKSLEALKAVAESHHMTDLGKVPEAINLLQRAIQYDPSYANAYYDLAASYSQTFDTAKERDAIIKAYSLRANASPLNRMSIDARYQAVVTRDLYAAQRVYLAWTQLYPHALPAWNGLSVVQAQLGDHRGCAVSTQRALELRPTIAALYTNVAENLTSLGDFKGARAVCERAIAKGMDSERIRFDLLRLAYVSHDGSLLAAQRAWLVQHPDSPLLLMTESEIAVAEGRFTDAVRLIEQSRSVYQRSGMASLGSAMTKIIAVELALDGDLTNGRRLFRGEPLDPEEGEDVSGLAKIGEASRAKQLLDTYLREHPQDTLWNQWYGPEIRAEAALQAHEPQKASEFLEPTKPLDGRDYTAALLRGQALLAAGQPQKAEGEFKEILAHPEIDPVSCTVSLASLGLARALAAESRHDAADSVYRRFMQIWSHADPDAALLKTAQEEWHSLLRLTSH